MKHSRVMPEMARLSLPKGCGSSGVMQQPLDPAGSAFTRVAAPLASSATAGDSSSRQTEGSPAGAGLAAGNPGAIISDTDTGGVRTEEDEVGLHNAF